MGRGGQGGAAGHAGQGGAVTCPSTNCSFATQGATTVVTCAPRTPLAGVDPGKLSPTRAFQLATTERESILAVGQRCGTDFFRIASDGRDPAASALSTNLDATSVALAARPRPGPGSEILAFGLTAPAALAGPLYVDNLGGFSLGPLTTVTALAPGQADYWHRLSAAAPPDGTRHALLDQRHFRYSDASAAWSELAPRPSIGWEEHATVDAGGRPVSFEYVAKGQVAMTLDGSTSAIGAPGVLAFRPVGPPSALLDASAPKTAVVLQYSEGLRVAWPGGSVLIAEPTLRRACTSDLGMYIDDSGCESQRCHEDGAGVGIGAFAAARAADGSVHVAYVRSSLDVTIQYGHELQGSCDAQRDLTTDASSASWHLVRVALDGSLPVELRSAVCAEPGRDYTGTPAIALHSFGERGAVARAVFDPANALRIELEVFDAGP